MIETLASIAIWFNDAQNLAQSAVMKATRGGVDACRGECIAVTSRETLRPKRAGRTEDKSSRYCSH
jgi:hypothetical protein